MSIQPNTEAPATQPEKKSFAFPSAVTTLGIVTVLVWVAALFIPAGSHQLDIDRSPIPGTYQQVDSPLSFGEKAQQLFLAPINGIYGLLNPDSHFVNTETVGSMFGQIGVIVFIMSIGAFIMVSFETRALEVAIGSLAHRLRSKGWLLITAAMVVLLAGGVSVIMNNTQTLDTILNAMEQLVSGGIRAAFAIITIVVNMPLAFLIPSSSGHAALAMPLVAPLADFASVSRSTTITAWIMGHGLTLMWSPTSVVLVGGLAIAKVGYDQYLKFAWPLLVALFVVSAAIVSVAAGLG